MNQRIVRIDLRIIRPYKLTGRPGQAMAEPKEPHWIKCPVRALYVGISVGEKYSGIEFFQTPGRTPDSGAPLGSIPGPTLATIPSSGRNGNLPIRGSFHISEYGRVQPYWPTETDLKTTI